MKKQIWYILLTTLLCFAMMFGLSACDKENDVTTADDGTTPSAPNESSTAGDGGATPGEDDGSIPSETIPVTEVGISNVSVELEPGETFQLTALVMPQNATNKAVSWGSSVPAVATVSNNGLVSAVAPGTASITVTAADGGKTISCTVTVTEKTPPVPAVIPVESIGINLSTITINVGNMGQLTATVLPNNATNKNIIWTSSNPSVATVNAGTVSGISAGVAAITATTEDGAKTASCIVTVTEPTPPPADFISVESISVSASTLSLTVGDAHQLTATVLPDNATNKNIIWTSSNPSVATVNAGTVSGISAGVAVITATTEDGAKTASCIVTVTEPTPPTPPTPTVSVPEYLGIYVSTSAPNATTLGAVDSIGNRNLLLPKSASSAASSSAWLLSFLQSRYEDGYYTLGQTLPPDSACDLYAKPGDTVFVGVWLNNPSQCTILSLTLNGVKYQVGGALQSYFYQGGRNCVFVEMEIPEGTYVEQSFTVDQIQYVEESNAISGNGKDVMLGDGDKTMSIGLPYEALPTIEINTESAVIGYDSVALSYSVSDPHGVISASGGWIRAWLVTPDFQSSYDQRAADGRTSVTFDNSSYAYIHPFTEYTMVFIGYFDLRDGNGPVTMELARYTFMTDGYLNVTATSDYHTYDYTEGGIEKQKKGAEITVSFNPEANKTATKIEIALLDGTVRYTASAEEVAALNQSKTVTLASPDIYNNTEQEVRVYYASERYETTTVKTPRIIAPTFAGSYLQMGTDYIDYVWGGIEDGYGGYESVPEYADYGSYLTSFHDENGVERVYTNAYATSKAGFFEFLVVDHEAAAILNVSDFYIYASGLQSTIYPVEKARYEYNTDGRRLYYAGKDENCKIGQNVPSTDREGGMFEPAEVEKAVHRYYLVDENYADYVAFDNLYYPKHYVEIYIDFNEGYEPVLCRFEFGLPRRDAWDDGNDEFLYNPDNNKDGTSADFAITTEGEEITLKYNAQSFPEKLYLVPYQILLESGGMLQVSFQTSGAYTPKDGDDQDQLPIGNEIELEYRVDGAIVDFESIKDDPALVKFRERGFTSYDTGTQRVPYFTASKYYMSEPIYEFSPEELAQLYASGASIENDWFQAYMEQITAGDGSAIRKVETPDFIVWDEVSFSLTDSDYPIGIYYAVAIMPETELYFTDAQPEYFADFDIHDTTIDFAYIQKLVPGTFPMLYIHGSTPVTVPENIRMEDGVIQWDGTTDANRVRVTIIYDRDGEVRKTAESLAYPEWTDTIDDAIHELIVANQVSEANVTVELEFINENGELYLLAPKKGNTFAYTRKPSQSTPEIEYICEYHENIVGEEWNSMLPDIANAGLIYAKINSPITDNLRYSINGGEWSACFAIVEGATYIGYMDGETARPLAIQYGDRIQVYYIENGYDALDSEMYDKTVTIHPEHKAILTPGDGTVHIGLGDALTIGITANSKLYPYLRYIEYRIDGGEITKVREDRFYDRNIALSSGLTIEVRLSIEPNTPANPLSERFLEAPVVGEWVSYTMP